MTPMQLGIEAERDVFAAAVITGLLMGALYSVFSVVRHTLAVRAFTFVADLTYSLLYGIAFCVASLTLTGYYRLFVLFGMLTGTVCWCLTAGRLAVWLLCGLIDTAVKYLLIPVIDKVYKLVTVIGSKFVKSHTNFKNRKKISEIT